MNQTKIIVVITTLLAAAAPAYGFSVDSVTGGDGEGSNAPSVGEVANTQEKLVSDYVEAQTNINEAQIMMAEALGLQEQVAALEDTATVLGSGSVSEKDEIEKVSETSADANSAISEKLQSADELSSESNEKIAKSMIPYSYGLKKTSDMAGTFKPFIESSTAAIEGASMANTMQAKNKLASGLYIAQNTPGLFSDLLGTGRQLTSYMEGQNVDVPDEASNTLGEL